MPGMRRPLLALSLSLAAIAPEYAFDPDTSPQVAMRRLPGSGVVLGIAWHEL
jgi:hypothetical protein